MIKCNCKYKHKMEEAELKHALSQVYSFIICAFEKDGVDYIRHAEKLIDRAFLYNKTALPWDCTLYRKYYNWIYPKIKCAGENNQFGEFSISKSDYEKYSQEIIDGV